MDGATVRISPFSPGGGRTTMTGRDGTFSVEAVGDTCQLSVYAFTFKKYEQSVTVPWPDTLLVRMEQEAQQIAEVVVRGQKPVLRMRDGNIVADVSHLARSGERLGDLLSKLPGVMSESNKRVSLYGMPATVYIDGVKQGGMALETYLQGMRGEDFAEVELISLPDARESGGTEAVIRIRRKRRQDDGYFLRATYGHKWYRGQNSCAPDLFYMGKRGNVDYNVSFAYNNYYIRNEATDSLRFGDAGTLYKETDTHGRGQEIRFVGNLNVLLPDNGHLRWNSYVYDGWEHPADCLLARQQRGGDRSNVNNQTRRRTHDDLWSTNLLYENSDSALVKWKASYGFVYGGLRSHNDYARTDDTSPYMHGRLWMHGFQHQGKIEASSRLGKHLVYAGTEISYGRVQDDALYTIRMDVPASDYTEHETLWSVYGGWRASLSGRVTLSASLRAERTDYRATYSGMTEEYKHHQWDLFPSLSATYSLPRYSATLGLMSSISRPNYVWMLPGARYGDDFSYTAGNPRLTPARTYIVRFDNVLLRYIHVNLRYYYGKDLLGQAYRSHEGQLLESTWLNYADRHGGSLYVSLPFRTLGGHFTGQVNHETGVSHFTRLSEDYEVAPGRKRTYWTHTESVYAQYDAGRFSTNVLASFYPRRSTLQSDSQWRWAMNWRASYRLLRNRQLAVSVEADDIFNTMKRKDRYYIGQVWRQVRVTEPFRHYVGIAVSYTFDSGAHVQNKARNQGGNDIRRFQK